MVHVYWELPSLGRHWRSYDAIPARYPTSLLRCCYVKVPTLASCRYSLFVRSFVRSFGSSVGNAQNRLCCSLSFKSSWNNGDKMAAVEPWFILFLSQVWYNLFMKLLLPAVCLPLNLKMEHIFGSICRTADSCALRCNQHKTDSCIV